VIIDNLDNSDKSVLKKLEQITKTVENTDFIFEEADIKDKPRLDEIFKKHGHVHSVIHFAGLKAVGVSCSQPLLYYENNVYGTINLLQVMEKYECKNIIFSSSATVYGDNRMARENDPVGACTNPYG